MANRRGSMPPACRIEKSAVYRCVDRGLRERGYEPGGWLDLQMGAWLDLPMEDASAGTIMCGSVRPGARMRAHDLLAAFARVRTDLDGALG